MGFFHRNFGKVGQVSLGAWPPEILEVWPHEILEDILCVIWLSTTKWRHHSLQDVVMVTGIIPIFWIEAFFSKWILITNSKKYVHSRVMDYFVLNECMRGSAMHWTNVGMTPVLHRQVFIDNFLVTVSKLLRVRVEARTSFPRQAASVAASTWRVTWEAQKWKWNLICWTCWRWACIKKFLKFFEFDNFPRRPSTRTSFLVHLSQKIVEKLALTAFQRVRHMRKNCHFSFFTRALLPRHDKVVNEILPMFRRWMNGLNEIPSGMERTIDNR